MKDEDHPKQDSGTKDNGWGGGGDGMMGKDGGQ